MKELNIAKEEFAKDKERWTDLHLNCIFRYSELQTQNSERELNLVLSLVSISVAFLTIVVPLSKEHMSAFFFEAIFFFILCSLSGVADILWTIKRDQRLLVEDRDWEFDTYGKYQSSAAAIYNKLLDDIFPIKDMEKYFMLGETTKEESKVRSEKRNFAMSTKLLKFLHSMFFGLFFAGFGFLLAAVF